MEYTQTQIEEMFRLEDNAQVIQSLNNWITEVLETLQEIRNFLKQKVNEALLPDFDKLNITLEPVLLLCKNVIASSRDADQEVPSLAGESIAADKNVSSQVEIRSREDVARVLEKVCKYIERTEPTNPVSLIIRLAQTLMTKNFLEILEAIPPEDMKVFKKIITIDSICPSICLSRTGSSGSISGIKFMPGLYPIRRRIEGLKLDAGGSSTGQNHPAANSILEPLAQ